MSKDSLTVIDNRTGRQHEIPTFSGTYPKYGSAINASALRSIQTSPEDFGLMSYDPGFANTASCRSRITFIDGERGILRHRVYKNYDPRAKIIKRIAEEVFEVTGPNPMLDVALELERIALSDDYFISHKLYPNVDFYSGVIYQAMGFPVEMFPVLFAIPRASGWIAQWEESLLDAEQKIARPQQVYTGADHRRVQALAHAA